MHGRHGLFGLGADTECRHCGSKEHATGDCPHDHGIFGIGADTECRHCGSNDHATKDCPHDQGIFGLGADTECSHCGSNNHSTEDCPHDHGLFGLGADTECRHCGSNNHATDDCPHKSIFSRKTENDGTDDPDSSSSTDTETYANEDDDVDLVSTTSLTPVGVSAHREGVSRMVPPPSAPVESDNARVGFAVLLVISALVGGFIILPSDIRTELVNTFRPPPPQKTESPPAVSSWIQPGETETKSLEYANAEIDRVYKALLATLNPAQQESLRQEEREWIKWRDAEADKIARSTSVGGSAYRLDRLNAMIRLVHQRTAYLRRYHSDPVRQPSSNIFPSPQPSQSQDVWLFPDSSSCGLNRSDLEPLDANLLWRARNEIYARKGFIFSSPRGKSFAASLGSAYRGVDSDQDRVFARMNKVEQANVELIKSLEQRKP